MNILVLGMLLVLKLITYHKLYPHFMETFLNQVYLSDIKTELISWDKTIITVSDYNKFTNNIYSYIRVKTQKSI